MNRNIAFLMLILGCAALTASPAFALDKKKAGEKKALLDSEKAQSAAEDKREEDLGDEDMVAQSKICKDYAGMLQLQADGDNPEVIGTLSTEDGRVYPLKLSNKALQKEVAPYDNKKISVLCKLRVNGKYLVVMALTKVQGGGGPKRTDTAPPPGGI